MSKLSLLDKLKVLSDVTSSSGLFAVAILFFVILTIILITTNTKTKKISKISCIIIYGIITLITLLFYNKQLFDFFDYMMNNFFIAIYFPNLAIYFAAIITSNIILWTSIFNRKITKWIRTINTIVFSIIHYLLILIINVITKNKLDIFSQTSVYQNQDAQALIELSSTIFIIWILFLIIYKIIRIYQEKQNPKEKIIVSSQEIKKEKPTTIVKTQTIIKRKLPDNIKKSEVPTIVFSRKKNKEDLKEKKASIIKPSPLLDDNSYLNDIPNPTLNETPQFLDIMLQGSKIINSDQQKELKQEKNKTKVQKDAMQKKEKDIFEGLLTLDDYKRVLAILKTYQEKEKQETKQISLSDFTDLYRKR